MSARVLNSLGLLVGIIGVLIIFKWGPPQPDHNPYEHIITERDPDPKVLADRELYRSRAATGLILVGIGFALQCVAVWVPSGVQAHAHKSD